VEDVQHIGEQGAIATGVDADAPPIDEADLDRGIREAAGSSDEGNGNKGRRSDRLIGCRFDPTVALGDGPSPGIEGVFTESVALAVGANG
jgi:hypothetical protein